MLTQYIKTKNNQKRLLDKVKLVTSHVPKFLRKMHYKISDIMLLQFYFQKLLYLFIPDGSIELPRLKPSRIHLRTTLSAGTMSSHTILNERIRYLKVLNLNSMETKHLLHLCNYHRTIPQILDFNMLRSMLGMALKKPD